MSEEKRVQGARDIALDALMQVERANAWSDEGLRRGITRGGLDSRDAALAARIAYGVMQNRMLLDFYIGCWCSQKVARLEPVIRNILRVGAYQILFLDKVPQHAAVSEAVEMTRQHGRPKAAGMVNAILRRIGANREHMPELPHESPEEYLSVRYSHPRWLVRRLLELLGPEEAEEYLRLDNEPVPTCIQTNFLKTDAPHLERELRGAGLNVQAHPWLAGCFLVTGTGLPRGTLHGAGRGGAACLACRRAGGAQPRARRVRRPGRQVLRPRDRHAGRRRDPLVRRLSA